MEREVRSAELTQSARSAQVEKGSEKPKRTCARPIKSGTHIITLDYHLLYQLLSLWFARFERKKNNNNKIAFAAEKGEWCSSFSSFGSVRFGYCNGYFGALFGLEEQNEICRAFPCVFGYSLRFYFLLLIVVQIDVTTDNLCYLCYLC